MGSERKPALRLSEVQEHLYDLISAPEGVAKRLAELGRTPDDLAEIVRPTQRLSAVERVDVYANMYFYRILDVLREEYERVVALVGDTIFHNVVTDYLLACRPGHPSLREVGARLPEYLARHPLVAGQPWVSELARLERMHLELFDGPDAEPLTLDEVRSIPPAELPALALRAIPCHALVRNRFLVSGLWKDPGAGTEAPAERPEALLVWRRGFTVFHRAVHTDEEVLLPLLAAGSRFEVICGRLAEIVPEDNVAGRAFELLTAWITGALIARR